MQEASITFKVTLEVNFPDGLDVEEVANLFLLSSRFSTSVVEGDPKSTEVVCSSSGVEEINSCRRSSP